MLDVEQAQIIPLVPLNIKFGLRFAMVEVETMTGDQSRTFLDFRAGWGLTLALAAVGTYLFWNRTRSTSLGGVISVPAGVPLMHLFWTLSRSSSTWPQQGDATMNAESHGLRPLQLALSLGAFLAVAYLFCLALALIVPDRGLHTPWLQFFPGFAWTPIGIAIGFAESILYGLFVGAVFAPIYNFFDRFAAH